ncbi:MAG: M20/M25/M40 family metallo-hydrolase, partial [Woeseiaceae bacterium]
MSVTTVLGQRVPRRMRLTLSAVVVAIVSIGISGETRADSSVRDVARTVSDYRQQNERAILTEYFNLLRLPNHAADLDDIQRNAEFIVQMLKSRGIQGRILSTGVGAPAVFGEVKAPGAETTIVFYVHYDGQPVVPANWDSDPFEPVLRTNYLSRGGKEIDFDSVSFPIDPDIRIFARSTSDDKAPIIGLLTAYDALRAHGIPLSANLKFFFEGEEESGSPHLEKMLAEHGDLLDADVLIFCDGPVHQSGRKKVSFGVRGPVGFEVTVYGPDRPLHSGHYG